jgi:hypothetical protein
MLIRKLLIPEAFYENSGFSCDMTVNSLEGMIENSC